MQEIVTRLFLSRQVRWDLILRVSRKIHDMFNLFTLFRWPTPKLLQRFPWNLHTSKYKGIQEHWPIWKKIYCPVFALRFFKYEQFWGFRAAWRTVALCIGPDARRRGRRAEGKALPLTCHFSNTMQLMTIVKTGMCYLTLQVHTGTNLEDIEHVLIFWNQITQDRCTRRTKEVNVKTIRR